MSQIKAVLRTIFYQNFLLIVGLLIGFILNAEYVGYKTPVIQQSFKNIFFPVKYDEDMLQNLKNWGAMKIWSFNDMPNGFEVIEDGMLAEEWYWCKFKYKNSENKEIIDIQSTRIRWKPWEYYFQENIPTTSKELHEYFKNDLNGIESDKALKLRNEKIKIEQKKIKT